MENFVVKLKLGRYFVAGLGLVEVPIGISRLKCGAWRLSEKRFPDLEFHTFKDAEYKKGAKAALLAALDIVHGYETTRLRAMETQEREIKETKLKAVGVSYANVFDGRRSVHRFYVSTPGGECEARTVYIGNDNTYLKNWDSAFVKARDIRHDWERQRGIDQYWNGLNAKKMSTIDAIVLSGANA